MATVFVIEGWMGDIEWSEGIYADEAHAQEVCDDLWATRSSEHAPEWTHGFCKFAVVPTEVIQPERTSA